MHPAPEAACCGACWTAAVPAVGSVQCCQSGAARNLHDSNNVSSNISGSSEGALVGGAQQLHAVRVELP
jgi:hypothetical protein